MNEYTKTEPEKAILVGCQLSRQTDEHFFYSLDELKSLTETAQGTVAAVVTQKRDRYDSATYIGSGKIEEIVALESELEADLIIFNGELTPSQNRNLSRSLSARVIDRTQLILDIFAIRARSREGKLQVELAQLEYMLPRLSGIGSTMSRLGAGIGTRGPGETKLEKDRRHIRVRIHELKRSLTQIASHRDRHRDRRKTAGVIQVALVGYTNAGKSTIFNRLTEAGTYEENQLFATLDPLTRKLKLPHGLSVLASDTVGFIQDLPTSLIAAFRSTLEEVKEADLLLHVIDGSHEDRVQHERTVNKILNELGASSIPVLTVFNKKDLFAEGFVPSGTSSLSISALHNEDIAILRERTEKEIMKLMEYYHIEVQASDGKWLSELKSATILMHQSFNEDKGVYECKGYAPKDYHFPKSN
ncbi:GTPase HflX [Fictibacillus iocasae]|uniref:GTPase HflX n=1 Tax=Fictibacillus iocasae TaxID=2715437 RepID=A0ABW2NTC9_9BACL